jgi:hypothetical protein
VLREWRLGRLLRRGIGSLRLWRLRRILVHLRVRVGCVGNCEFALDTEGLFGKGDRWEKGDISGEICWRLD